MKFCLGNSICHKLGSCNLKKFNLEPWKLQADNTHCWGTDGTNRVTVGWKQTILECYKDVISNKDCGSGFEFKKSDNGWCACGRKNTANSDCRGDVSSTQSGSIYTITSGNIILVYISMAVSTID